MAKSGNYKLLLAPEEIKIIADLISKGAVITIGGSGVKIRADHKEIKTKEDISIISLDLNLPDKDFEYLAMELDNAFRGKSYLAVDLIAHIFIREMLYWRYKKDTPSSVLSNGCIAKNLSRNMKEVLNYFHTQRITRKGLEHIKGTKVSEPEALATMRMVIRFLELI